MDAGSVPHMSGLIVWELAWIMDLVYSGQSGKVGRDETASQVSSSRPRSTIGILAKATSATKIFRFRRLQHGQSERVEITGNASEADRTDDSCETAAG